MKPPFFVSLETLGRSLLCNKTITLKSENAGWRCVPRKCIKNKKRTQCLKPLQHITTAKSTNKMKIESNKSNVTCERNKRFLFLIEKYIFKNM